MQNELNQEDILSLLKAANQSGKKKAEGQRTITPWQAERTGQFRSDQASMVTDVQDALAKGLTQSLGAYLGASFETNSIAVVQMTFGEAIEHTANGTYSITLRLLETPAVIQIENALVFPLIDILLGGTGQGQMENRALTEIEDHVIGGIGRIISHEIATAWGINSADCEMVGAQGLTQTQRLMSLNDRVVVLQFDSKMGETTGRFNVLVTGTTFTALLRKLALDGSQLKAKADISSWKLRTKVLECTFPVSVGVTAIRLPLDRVLGLKPGQVCDLGVPVSQPGCLNIAGRDVFDANPVRQGRKRAAHIGKPRQSTAERKS